MWQSSCNNNNENVCSNINMANMSISNINPMAITMKSNININGNLIMCKIINLMCNNNNIM
jgi:hypothetical protein